MVANKNQTRMTLWKFNQAADDQLKFVLSTKPKNSQAKHHVFTKIAWMCYPVLLVIIAFLFVYLRFICDQNITGNSLSQTTNITNSSQYHNGMDLIYRRVLPSSSIDFTSKQGEDYLEESIGSGYANIFFKIAAQLRTQQEPPFCAVSTLVTVLNALKVDPGRLWRWPWQWYDEYMLDCCHSMDYVRQYGLTLKQFGCLAVLNNLQLKITYAGVENPDGTAAFRQAVRTSTRSFDTILVVTYGRAVLNETGEGHFSPIGAYHMQSDSALIMDVARFKYPPHWVSVDHLWEAMGATDLVSGRPRGYAVLKVNPKPRSLIVEQLLQTFSDLTEDLLNRIKWWNAWLEDPRLAEGLTSQEIIRFSVEKFTDIFDDMETCCAEVDFCDSGPSKNHCGQLARKVTDGFCTEIRLTRIYGRFHERSLDARASTLQTTMFLAWPYLEFSKIGGILLEEVQGCSLSLEVTRSIAELRNAAGKI